MTFSEPPQDEPHPTTDADDAPENDGAEHSDGPPLPFAPDKEDDSALGDTDQHSDA